MWRCDFCNHRLFFWQRLGWWIRRDGSMARFHSWHVVRSEPPTVKEQIVGWIEGTR